MRRAQTGGKKNSGIKLTSLRILPNGRQGESHSTNPWTATSTMGAPAGRFGHTAVWTGEAMIVWGGMGGSAPDTGGVYTLTSTLSLSPTSQSFTASGGTGAVTVTAPGSCTWRATSNANRISITSGGTGAGNGMVNFTVAANTGTASRTGTITIGLQTFTVTQAGQ